jgi:hypothetical protein
MSSGLTNQDWIIAQYIITKSNTLQLYTYVGMIEKELAYRRKRDLILERGEVIIT